MQIFTPSIIENEVIIQKETITHLICPKCDFDITEEEIKSCHCNKCNADFESPHKFYQVFRGK
jgi:ribosomal protein L37AE/L43A